MKHGKEFTSLFHASENKHYAANLLTYLVLKAHNARKMSDIPKEELNASVERLMQFEKEVRSAAIFARGKLNFEAKIRIERDKQNAQLYYDIGHDNRVVVVDNLYLTLKKVVKKWI